MIPPEVRLYSWLDVEDTVLRSIGERGSWPEWLVDVRAYWDGVWVRVRPDAKDRAKQWLRELFEPRIIERESHLFSDVEIVLEAPDGRQRTLAVTIEETDEKAPELRMKPSFARPGIVQPGLTEPLDPTPFPEGSPAVFAFHSFKGGVGRTLHALALSQVIAATRGPVLLVDADLEAPGITWLLESRLPSMPIAFADVLALVHGESDPCAHDSIALASARLKGADMNGVYVLPAFRSTRSFQSLDIRPEHLTQGSADPFLLSSVLVALGRSLRVEAVLVDLRAGLSELAAGLLLDPRVYRVFVTTLSGQSLSGTELVLDLVRVRAPSMRENHPIPMVILNEVPAEPRSTTTASSAEERLLAAVSLCVSKEVDVVASDVLRTSWFDANLLTLSPSWDEVLSVLQRSQIHDSVKPLAQLVPAREPTTVAPGAPGLDRQREALSSTAGRLIYAEAGEGEDFLPISPLRRLIQDHRAQVPAAVIVGAKGAGKTYTYFQVVRRREWQEFAEAAGEARSSLDAVLCPVLQPKNVSGKAPLLLREARLVAAKRLGLGSALDAFSIQDTLQNWLQQNFHEGEWRERWLDLMAWTAGFRPNQAGAGRDLPEYLSELAQHLVLVFDGLEDLFQNIATSDSEQRALRSLLQDVPNWLDQQPDRRTGILIFVRRDMVAAAVRQNSAQLLARYEPYALKWDRVEALRLVAWVAYKAGLFPALTVDRIRQMDQETLTTELIPLWGRKLGGDKSREGRSAEWVIAALSDFRGQIQARDIVRFLHVAAKRSVDVPQWSDRVLVPVAVRDAVADCSTEKISEISHENPALRDIFEKLRAFPQNQKSIPFKRGDVALDAQELQLLELNGIVVAEEGEYYMPEIFRRGLGFGLPFGARPKVLALSRRRQGGVA